MGFDGVGGSTAGESSSGGGGRVRSGDGAPGMGRAGGTVEATAEISLEEAFHATHERIFAQYADRSRAAYVMHMLDEFIHHGAEVAAFDLDVYSADMPLFMNLTPAYSLRDLAGNFKRLDSVFIQNAMMRHPSGLQLLAAPPAAAAPESKNAPPRRGVLRAM